MKGFKWLDRIVETACFLALAMLVLIVTLQVASRFLPFSYVWTEELSRFLFIYAVVFGAPLAIRDNAFVNVDFIVNKFSRRAKEIYDIAVTVAIFLFLILTGIKGIDYLVLGLDQRSPTMPIPMAIPYAGISITSFLMALYCLQNLHGMLARKGGDRK